ncbi:tRNA (cytosine(38)-C(5))-methyltransferase [Dermacentor andersoni]|uniref:tRNA (cytosine(38)-C(5))-methyltransferase n=1 Tax=Dermacentor andersoni TaxID=34620 RepID=UPI002155A028|nr:tRNA (cytosine(38)-C(5))-methyltransferase-like [Dermacentor andersoni]
MDAPATGMSCAPREADDTSRAGDVGKLRVLELYSGIGGMHFACRPDRTSVVAAVDVNTTANSVYAFNFPETRLLQRNVQSLSAREIDSLQPDLVTMSPPCQPFTRQGLQRDSQDPRSSSLFSFLTVLSTLKHKPKYILLENVKGFETSATHSTLTQVLQGSGYHIHRYLLSPTQFGVPNSRLRFYCLAKLHPAQFRDCRQEDNGVCSGACQEKPPPGSQETGPPQSLSSFLSLSDEQDLRNDASYLLPDKILSRFSLLLDIVEPASANTCCFTKGYAHYVEGTGSVLLQAPMDDMHEVYRKVPHKEAVPEDVLEMLRNLRLRYFTPQEVARLMCFPECFAFPPDLKPKHRYQLLGNSVNVRVVRALLDYLLDDVPES